MKNLSALLLVLVLATGAVVATLTPMMKLRPFAPQTADDVTAAYLGARWAPLLTVAALVLAVALTAVLWRGKARWFLKVPAVLALVVLAGAVFVSRVNPIEQMFAPMTETGFVAAADAEHVVPEEMVLGVVVDGQAKAYPVGMVAYHHIVNDDLGGVPIVVTY